MTCHVAITAAGIGSVAIADSQGSTQTSEIHGLHKQLVGKDFVLGMAGNSAVGAAVLEHVSRSGTGAAGVEAKVKEFIAAEVVPTTPGLLELLLTTENGNSVLRHGILRSFGAPTAVAAIGSGAEFVQRVLKLERSLPQWETIADLLVTAEGLMDASNESLTVDDKLSVGLLINGKAYLLGDAGINPSYCPLKLSQNWSEVAEKWGQLCAMSRSIRGEVMTTRITFASEMAMGRTSDPAAQAMAALTIQSTRTQMLRLINDYCIWYDKVLGRS